MAFQSFPKPLRGSALLASRARTAERKKQERRVMLLVVHRDGNKCRVPHCVYAAKKLPIDVCHERHRGMGGDKSATHERTQTRSLFCACRIHHSLYDAHELDAQPMTPEGFDGVCSFFERDRETGAWVNVANEIRIGVSEPRGL